MTNEEKITMIDNIIKLLGKAIADNTYDGIVMPNMPEIVLKQLEEFKKELENETTNNKN
jgi:hypothetical protein